MNPLGMLLFAACAVGLFALPRRWAFVPLLAGCCYVTPGQALYLGSFSLPVYRLLLLVGVIRVIVRREHLPGGVVGLDRLMFVWCGWTVFASLFQPNTPGSGIKYVTSAVFTVAAGYFVLRALCRDLDDVRQLVRCACILLVPVAAAMVLEKLTQQNVFSIFGRVPEVPLVRGGRIRAQGPFSHPILAGTIGATFLPLILVIWRQHRRAAMIGAAACLLMVFASASSGPIMSMLFGAFAIVLWRYRQYCGLLRKLAILGYLGLWLVMSQPPYFLVARVDLAGGSTGWHRAYLIQQTIAHFPEWALFGTNQTRHWMPAQGYISETSTDITNYFIVFGVLGGFLCMALVLLMVGRSFKSVGEYVRHPATSSESSFAVWSVGAALFAHVTSSFSISYFGQTPMFFWLPIAVIASLHGVTVVRGQVAPSLGRVGAVPTAPQPVFDEVLGARTYRAPDLHARYRSPKPAIQPADRVS